MLKTEPWGRAVACWLTSSSHHHPPSSSTLPSVDSIDISASEKEKLHCLSHEKIMPSLCLLGLSLYILARAAIHRSLDVQFQPRIIDESLMMF